MIKRYYEFIFLFAFLIPQWNFGKVNQETAISRRTTNDSLLIKHKSERLLHLSKGDTLSAIGSILELSNIYSTTGNYSQSYDGYWEALILSKTISDSIYVANIYRRLGTLYSIFRRAEKAETYFKQSLKTIRASSNSKSSMTSSLNETFQILASHHIEQGNYGLASKYLDSCCKLYLNIPNNVRAFSDTKRGYIDYHLGNYDSALNKLLSNEDYFKKHHPSYLVIFYSFLGDIYSKTNNYKEAEKHFLKALAVAEQYKSHSNFIPDLYGKLGDLYFNINKKDLAYEHLQRSKDISEELFGIRSKINSDILEIKDTYRIENEKQQQNLEVAKLNRLEQQQKTLFFRNIALTVSVISLILMASISVWYLHKRRTSEKRDFLKRQKLSREKNEEILALKNRELTSSSLQLIQKDALILEIKDLLKSVEFSNKKEVKDILTKIKINKNFDWKQFNARFTSVNKIFYKTLSEKFPELTRKDHRLCALIKLNFTSKEISQLLGISPLSVNTSRYRLRKKMKLVRDEDLFDVISKL
ncbi:MAG: tetratricopeptide repeat protein [Jejuia sp.]